MVAATSQTLSISLDPNDIITFNIGGYVYSTKSSTISENVDSHSFLSRILKNPMIDDHNRYFIDRDGKYFGYILNYLREQKLHLPEDFHEYSQLLSEARFYQIDRMINDIENHLNRRNETHLQRSSRTLQLTLMSTVNPPQTISKIIAPLEFLHLLPIQTVGEQFLSIISSVYNPQNLRCQFTFPYHERLIACQPLDQLQRFVLTKQAKQMSLIVSYSDDYFYIPLRGKMISREDLSKKFHGQIVNANTTHDDSATLVENWLLPIQFDETYPNASMTTVH